MLSDAGTVDCGESVCSQRYAEEETAESLSHGSHPVEISSGERSGETVFDDFLLTVYEAAERATDYAG